MTPQLTPQSRIHPTTAAARIAPLLIALAGLAIAIACQWLWQHRRQIAAALITAAAATYAAGAWCREQIEALAADSARRLPAQPVAALAPITAGITAVWGLVDRSTMARAEQARRAQLADYDQRCAICCCTCGPAAAAFAIEPIEPGEELLSPIRYRSSNAASAIEPGRFQAVVRVDRRRINA
jgi:hypothetical protein